MIFSLPHSLTLRRSSPPDLQNNTLEIITLEEHSSARIYSATLQNNIDLNETEFFLSGSR